MSHLQGGGWSEGGFGTKKELGAREEITYQGVLRQSGEEKEDVERTGKE